MDQEFVICSRCRHGCQLNEWFERAIVISGIKATRSVCPKCRCESFYKEKPLFIPLARRWFEEFESGKKNTEYRLHNERWNAKTCRPGRKGHPFTRLLGATIDWPSTFRAGERFTEKAPAKPFAFELNWIKRAMTSR